MGKYTFSNSQRFAVWSSFDCKCFWCGEPLDFSHTTIDHLFPENLLDDENELEKTKRLYQLPLGFEINDFCNWVPSHSICNSKKSTRLPSNSPAFLLLIPQVIKKSVDVKRRFLDLVKNLSKDKVIGRAFIRSGE